MEISPTLIKRLPRGLAIQKTGLRSQSIIWSVWTKHMGS